MVNILVIPTIVCYNINEGLVDDRPLAHFRISYVRQDPSSLEYCETAVFTALKRARYGIELQDRPGMGQRGARDGRGGAGILPASPAGWGVFNLLPTRHLGVPSLEIERQVGVRRPVAVYIITLMELPSGDGSVRVKFNFSGIGCLRSIIYNEVETPALYAGLDPWRVIDRAWGLLPPKSKR